MTAILEHSPEASNRDLSLFLTLLQPSWLSGLLAVFASLAIVIGTIVASNFTGSSLQQLWQAESTKNNSISSNYRTADVGLSSNTIISDIPLFILWGCVGMIAYAFVINIVNAGQNVAELKAELDFVHVDRRRLMRTAGIRLLTRLAVLAIWLAFIRFSMKILLPYALAVIHFASGSVGWFNNIAYTILGFAVLAVCIHFHTIFLRLLRLRPRLFS
jgi:hypothetical protein